MDKKCMKDMTVKMKEENVEIWKNTQDMDRQGEGEKERWKKDMGLEIDKEDKDKYTATEKRRQIHNRR